MRKHFLLLFLLALLPLAGWAADYDPNFTFSLTEDTYAWTGSSVATNVQSNITDVNYDGTPFTDPYSVGYYSNEDCTASATPTAPGNYWVQLSYVSTMEETVKSVPQSFTIVTTDVTVTLYDFTIPYGAEPTAATLKAQYPTAVKVEGATWDQIKGYLTFARVNDGSANWNSNNVGVYSWTLTKALDTGGYNIYLSSNNAKLTIEKATITEDVAGTLAADCTYGSLEDPLQLVVNAPTLSLAAAQSAIEYSLDEE